MFLNILLFFFVCFITQMDINKGSTLLEPYLCFLCYLLLAENKVEVATVLALCQKWNRSVKGASGFSEKIKINK